MLEKITIKNFRNLENITIEPALITLLIGPNGTGKSGIFHALCTLKQSFEGESHPTEIKVAGNQINLGSREEVVHNHDNRNKIEIGIDADFTIPASLSSLTNSSRGKVSFVIQDSTNSKSRNISTQIGTISLQIPHTVASGNQIMANHQSSSEGYVVDESRGFGVTGHFVNQSLQPLNDYFDTEIISSILDTVYYVPVQRGISQFKTQIGQSKPDSIITSQGTAKLTQDILETIHYDLKLVDKISELMERLFKKKVRPALIQRGLGDTEQDVSASTKGTAEFFDSRSNAFASNSGFGLNQILFLFVQVLKCPEGSIILIEEPEISLHPVAQKELMEILIEIAKTQKKQIMFTSHSEHIAFAFFKAVEDGRLTRDQLRIYSFEGDGTIPPTIKEISDSKQSMKSFLGNRNQLLIDYMEALDA